MLHEVIMMATERPTLAEEATKSGGLLGKFKDFSITKIESDSDYNY